MSEEAAPLNAGFRDAPALRGRSVRARSELFLISFLILFFELACIRWFGAMVLFLTFFTNIILMACFLGVSVGCLAASRKTNWMNAFAPLAVLATGSAVAFLWAYNTFSQVMIDVGTQQSPQLIYFGTDARVKDPSKWVVPIEALAGYFFVLIAIMFVGLGQEMGRRLGLIERRLEAYTVDILGSLAGIAAFGLMSYSRAPAWAWFVIALGLGAFLVPRRRIVHAVLGLIVAATVATADRPWDSRGMRTEVFWSPYYQVRFNPRFLSIDVNNLGHQAMLRVGRGGSAYFLPHLLNRDSGEKPFENVLIIGAGSGNDTAAALAMGAREVDAVEIDPVINGLGRRLHPNRPFEDPRVSIHLDDGRSFVRRTRTRYDYVGYAVVDSLALHSSYSSVRLESFLFTEQAFRDVKAKLKPGGVFAMYNFYRKGWVVARLVELGEKVFGSPPLVLSLPYQEVISRETDQRDHITFLLFGNGKSPVLEAIRSKFESERFYWLNREPRFNLRLNGFARKPPVLSGAGVRAAGFSKIGPTEVEATAGGPIPTDDWPFLYLREAKIPALNLRGMAIIAALSLAILFAFAPVRTMRPAGRMFFLGAGFMLLETKGVVHMALLFGATWMVNSIVFFAILTMILLSNLYVSAVKPRRLGVYFALLIASLAVNCLVPMDDFLALPGATKVIASCAVVFLPVFFAGVIFATEFASSVVPEVDFGSNIGGIILGGLSEHLSLVLGFNHLLWAAIVYYLLAAWLAPRR